MAKQQVLIEIELGARPSEREMEVVDILVLHGIPKRHVKFLRASRAKGSKTPDLMIDLRRLSIELEKKAQREVEKEFLRNKSWKGLLVVVRYDGEELTFHK